MLATYVTMSGLQYTPCKYDNMRLRNFVVVLQALPMLYHEQLLFVELPGKDQYVSLSMEISSMET